jgi:hypothetical protein
VSLFMKISVRKHLCADTLVTAVYNLFCEIPDPRKSSSKIKMPFTDILMSGLAIFGLKFPSLLKYDQHRQILDQNLLDLYHITTPPSDTYLSERLDELDPKYIRPAFKKIFSMLQRGNCLENFEGYEGHYFLALDATGEFSSTAVCCPKCCKKEYKDGSISYYHQMLGACIVHPDHSYVIPLCPELIQNGDGSEKNDCERNAAKRLIAHFRREHPHLKVIVLADGIASNAPYIRLLEEFDMKYMLGAKPGDHEYLFKKLHESEESSYYEVRDDQGFLHQFYYLNQVPLNKSNPDVLVNVLEYMQTNPKGKETKFSWVTNITLTKNNIFTLMKGGRARWKIENETFNTLKNLGYNFEHNYGHGKKYLSTIFCLLMMLAFLIDQVQGIACNLFAAIRKRAGSLRGIWENMRVLLQFMRFTSWEALYQTMASTKLINNTS